MTRTLRAAFVVLLWQVGGAGGQEWIGGPDFNTLDAVTPTVPNSESNAGATAEKALSGSGKGDFLLFSCLMPASTTGHQPSTPTPRQPPRREKS